MAKLLAGLISLFTYLAIGTVLVEAGTLGFLWWNGSLTAEKTEQMVRILYGVDDSMTRDLLRAETPPPPSLTYDEIRHYRAKMNLDQDLRESSLYGSADDFDYIDSEYAERRRRFERIRRDFDTNMARLQGAATDRSLTEVRDTLRSLKPDQAADQMVRLLEQSRSTGNLQQRDDMVTILKTLPAATQKKLLAEFQTEERSTYLYDMLTQIRLGMPDVETIRETRNRLQQYQQRFPDSGEP